MPEGELARIERFCAWLEDVTSTRTEPWRFGTALFNDDFPNRWDSNFLRAERPMGEVTVPELVAEADRVLGTFRHRKFVVLDETEGARLAMAFGEQAWEVDHLVYMVLHRAPDREPEKVQIDEVTFEEVRPLVIEVNRRAHPGTSEDDATMLADFRRVLVDRVGARFFAARIEGALVGLCDLYVHDGIGQVEDVDTLEEYRNRGLARAFVVRAAREARAAGADLVCLVADANDWPQQLYARLGFDAVGRFWQFTRPTPG